MFWRATYTDGSVIEQPATSIPIEYHNIDTNKLKEFVLTNEEICIGANIIDGVIFIDGNKIGFEGFSNKEVYRLIYYIHGSPEKPIYYLGIQTTINKRNIKRIVRIENKDIKILV